jgi:hypothetical protein
MLKGCVTGLRLLQLPKRVLGVCANTHVCLNRFKSDISHIQERYGVLSADCHEDFNMETLENDICILNLQGVCIHPPVSLNLKYAL